MRQQSAGEFSSGVGEVGRGDHPGEWSSASFCSRATASCSVVITSSYWRTW